MNTNISLTEFLYNIIDSDNIGITSTSQYGSGKNKFSSLSKYFKKSKGSSSSTKKDSGLMKWGIIGLVVVCILSCICYMCSSLFSSIKKERMENTGKYTGRHRHEHTDEEYHKNIHRPNRNDGKHW